MNAKTLIHKSREGGELSREEIDFLVSGAVSGEIPDYQLTAWLMAVFFRGLSHRETADLTRAMLNSGERLSLDGTAFPPADKHSTGGVGDKISFLVAPLVAAAGVPVPMISGRSLGHTGGTLDKLESIPGFRTRLTPQEVVRQVHKIGLCIAGQSERLAPADRILYALRDAASIVESVPLITASILCKKAAAGIRALALDVKFGEGAFMPDAVQARSLAESLVDAAAHLGIRARAHLTSMHRVLGRTAGNALEIAESARALKGEAVSPDLRELTLELGGSMLELAGAASTRQEGERQLERLWQSQAGFESFLRMVEAQGGDPACILDPERLPRAQVLQEVPARESGVFLGIRARPAGEWITEAGGGRMRAGDAVDPRVGLEILTELGSRIGAGESVLRLHLPESGVSPALLDRAAGWILVGDPSAGPGRLVLDAVEPRSSGSSGEGGDR